MASLDIEKLKVVKSAKLPGDLLSIACTADSEQLWIGSSDGKVYGVDLAADKLQPIALEGHRSYVSGAVLAGKQLITASWDKQLIWWDVENRKPLRTVPAHQKWIRQLALSPDGNIVASIADDMVVRLWDAESGKLIRELKGHSLRLPRYEYPNKLYACGFSADGKFLAVNDETAQVIVWETATGKESVKFQAGSFYHGNDWERNNHPYGGLRCLAFAPDGQTLALAGIQNTDVAIINGHALVQLFDWQTGKHLHEFKTNGSNSQYEVLRFDPDGDWLLAGIGGGSKTVLHFFDVANKRLLKEHPSAAVFGLSLGDDGESLYTVGRGGHVTKWANPA